MTIYLSSFDLDNLNIEIKKYANCIFADVESIRREGKDFYVSFKGGNFPGKTHKCFENYDSAYYLGLVDWFIPMERDIKLNSLLWFK